MNKNELNKFIATDYKIKQAIFEVLNKDYKALILTLKNIKHIDYNFKDDYIKIEIMITYKFNFDTDFIDYIIKKKDLLKKLKKEKMKCMKHTK